MLFEHPRHSARSRRIQIPLSLGSCDYAQDDNALHDVWGDYHYHPIL
jgi:hypothetical protein